MPKPKKRLKMAKVIKILDYQFRKMRESITHEREIMLKRHKERMKETQEIIKRIRDNRAEFERKWFKFLKGGKL